MEAENQMILENIDEFLNDENKVVTYKWLSLTLSIHVETSKRLLEEYVHKHPNSGLKTIYFLTGIISEDSCRKIQCLLVKGDSLDHMRLKFENITSCHIYSVQKFEIKNSDVLHQTDLEIVKEKVRELCIYSSIRYKESEKIGQSRHQIIQPIQHQANDEQVENVKAATKREVKKEKNKTESPPLNFFPKNTKNKSTPTTEATGKKKDDNDENCNKVKMNVTTNKNNILKSFEKSTSTKITGNNKGKTTTEDTRMKEDKQNITTENTQIKDGTQDMTTEIPRIKDERQNVTTGDTQIKDEKQDATTEDAPCKENRQLNLLKENVGVMHTSTDTRMCSGDLETKSAIEKRKGFIDSSESDDDFENFVKKSKSENYNSNDTPVVSKTKSKVKTDTDEDMDVVAPTPEPVKVKSKLKRRKKGELKEESFSTDDNDKLSKLNKVKIDKRELPSTPDSKLNSEKRRLRRRVLKSKQYINEEGYMVTQKAYESESYSEESDIEIIGEQEKTLSPEKREGIASKNTVKELEQKTKYHDTKPKHQASLTSFFKRQ